MDHVGRIDRLRQKLDALEAGALLVTNVTNVRYLTGFSGTNGQVLVTPGSALFLTDPRYEARASDLVSGADIEIYPTKLSDVLGPRVTAAGLERLGLEANTVTLAERDALSETLPGIELVAIDGAIEELRRTKDPDEVEAMTRAVQMADEAFTWILDRLVVGATEREVAIDLEVRMRLDGADAVSFDPIVGSGPLSAHIHHSPSERTFEKGDLVLLDFGCRVDGYCSDMTRTVVLGPASDTQRENYGLVLAAQRAGIDAARAAVPGRDLHAAAHRVVDDGGLADLFPHSVGHGIGLDIHETPSLKVSDEPLLPGEAVTIEPGVYVPGDGGIRIEDVVVITEDGCDVLTGAAKDTLLEL